MDAMVYGYVRVSTKDQNEERQMIAMKEFGVPEEQIFMDKLSGKNFDRPRYKRLIKKLRPGDVIVIKSIDRLGRDYGEIQEQWRRITKGKRADIVVLDMPLLDTRSRDKDLTGTFIADLVLQILSYVAQVERENIHQRQAEGIAAARARGVKFGRKRKQVPQEFYRLQALYDSGQISARQGAKLLGIAHSTFLKWNQEHRNGEMTTEWILG